MPSDLPTPEMVRDTSIEGGTDRLYSTVGYAPVRISLSPPNTFRSSWYASALWLGPNDWMYLFSHTIDDPGDDRWAEADRQAAFAIRLLAEAREAARND